MRLTSVVAYDQALAAVTLPPRIAWIDATGDDLMLPRLLFGVAKNATFHPIRAFGVGTSRVPALVRLEIPQMLSHQYACSILGCELDNADAHQVGHGRITVADATPEVGIVLLSFGQNASLRSVACDPSEQPLPKARYLCAPANEAGSQDGAFDRLDGTHSDVLIDVHINGADLCIRARDVFCYCRWCSEGLLDGGMQPPLPGLPHEVGAPQRNALWQIAGQRVHLYPTPARSGPDVEHDALPHPGPSTDLRRKVPTC